MKAVALLLILGSLGLSLFLGITAYNKFLDSLQWERYYEAERNELESVYRTIGKGADPAYRCESKRGYTHD